MADWSKFPTVLTRDPQPGEDAKIEGMAVEVARICREMGVERIDDDDVRHAFVAGVAYASIAHAHGAETWPAVVGLARAWGPR